MSINADNDKHSNYLRLNNVQKKLDVKRKMLWEIRQDVNFPKGTKLSKRVTVWKESEIDDYMDSLPKE